MQSDAMNNSSKLYSVVCEVYSRHFHEHGELLLHFIQSLI